MNKKNKIITSLIINLALVSCTNVTNTPISPIPTSTSTVASPTVTASVTMIPSISSSTPVNSPLASVSVTPTTIQSLVPSVSPRPTQEIKEKGYINGTVYDDKGSTVQDTKVTVKSLDSDFKAESTTINGLYTLYNVPIGERLEITAYKSDTWTTKTQSYIARSILNGLYNNIVDFGDNQQFGSSNKNNFFFLSDSPEIISITPNDNVAINPEKFQFKLTFSEPVNKKSVEENLSLRYVRTNFASDVIVGDGTDGTENTDGPPLLAGNSQFIIDKSRQNLIWDSLGKELTVNITQNLLTNNQTAVRYALSLRNNTSSVKLADIQGNKAFQQGEFNIGSVRSKNIIFSVNRDLNRPILDSVELDKVNNKSIITLNFSKTMTVEQFDNKDLRDISFYTIYKNNQIITLSNPYFRTGQKSIEIISDSDTFDRGDKIKVEVNPNLKDPAGNFFSEGVTLGEFDNIKEETYND